MNPLASNIKNQFLKPFTDLINGGTKPAVPNMSVAPMSSVAPKPIPAMSSTSTVSPMLPTPTGAPIAPSSWPMSTPKVPTTPTPTGDPNVRAQQIALNAKGAGLKEDGLLGPLTMAAIQRYGATTDVAKTGSGGIINPATGGVTDTPVPPPVAPVAPTAPPVVPTAAETGVTSAENAYKTAGLISPEQDATQAELDNLLSSTRLGVSNKEGQGRGIPLDLIRGQQAQLEKQGLLLAEPLNAKLARLQATRTAALEASKFALERADKKLTTEQDKTKPISGTSFYDPVTGTFKTAPEKTTAADKTFSLAPGETRYDENGNVIVKAPDASTTPSSYAQERNFRNLQSVDSLMGQVNNWTTGFGSLLSVIPTSDARNFKAQLDTLKANITFGELTAMREASKTGGALGQVSDVEGRLLGAALGALDTAVTPEQFKVQLKKIKDSIERWQSAAGGTATNAGGNVVKTTVGDINTNW